MKNKVAAEAKEFLPNSSFEAVFATYTLIPHDAYHVIEVFVSKRLHNGV